MRKDLLVKFVIEHHDSVEKFLCDAAFIYNPTCCLGTLCLFMCLIYY